MILQERITIMARLGEYMLGMNEIWAATQERAYRENQWFIPHFIETSIGQIAVKMLKPDLLEAWVAGYSLESAHTSPKTVGIVMAGNIPLVGFFDLLCVFISGHRAMVKTSSKDEILIKHLVDQLCSWEPAIRTWISFSDRLNGCDAFIATGSNNSGRYFDYYFAKYPHIIRRNRTSVALIDGTETPAELISLSDDIQLYFGLGCRNVTQLFVPKDYDFIPLLDTLRRYDYFQDYHKYKHNFDYHLALLIMGNKYYMSNESIILTENISPFSPVSQVHYQYYEDKASVVEKLVNNTDLQCIVGHGYTPFGQAQSPGLTDYADGVDTMQFLKGL
jgi:hypothetical protein